MRFRNKIGDVLVGEVFPRHLRSPKVKSWRKVWIFIRFLALLLGHFSTAPLAGFSVLARPRKAQRHVCEAAEGRCQYPRHHASRWGLVAHGSLQAAGVRGLAALLQGPRHAEAGVGRALGDAQRFARGSTLYNENTR